MARLFRKATDTPTRSLWQRIKDIALMDVGVAVRGVQQGSLERLEEILLEADFGVPTTIRLVEARGKRPSSGSSRHGSAARGGACSWAPPTPSARGRSTSSACGLSARAPSSS